MILKNRLQRRVSLNQQICAKTIFQPFFFEGDMTICNYHHLMKILAKKTNYTGGTESGSGTLCLLFLSRIIENQNSVFVMQ